jgi:hypothetical protein
MIEIMRDFLIKINEITPLTVKIVPRKIKIPHGEELSLPYSQKYQFVRNFCCKDAW